MRFLIAALLLALSAACTGNRYVGSIGRAGIYSNRGYGLTLKLDNAGVLHRWRIINPQKLEGVPPRVRPKEVMGPIDLDGNGNLDPDEHVHYQRPTLRLVSRGSLDTTIDVDVRIAGGKLRNARLEDLLIAEARRITLTRSSTTSVQMTSAKLGPGYPAVIGEFQREARVATDARAYRVAIVDQARVYSEGEGQRRQLVLVTLSAPVLTDELRSDQDRILAGLLLSDVAGSKTSKEQW